MSCLISFLSSHFILCPRIVSYIIKALYSVVEVMLVSGLGVVTLQVDPTSRSSA